MNRSICNSAITVLALLAAVQPASAAPPQSHGVQMNERWVADDMEVAQWVRQFEDPKRDVIAHRPAVVAALGLRPGQAVADVGAGTGAYLAALSTAVGPTGRVIAVDISPGFVAHMNARAKAEGLANVSAQLGAAAGPGLPDESQDTIISVNTFHHFADAAAMLAAIRRALKPGGQLAIVDFDRNAPGATDHQRKMAADDKAGYIRTIEAAGFRLVEDVTSTGLTQNFMLRFERS